MGRCWAEPCGMYKKNVSLHGRMELRWLRHKSSLQLSTLQAEYSTCQHYKQSEQVFNVIEESNSAVVCRTSKEGPLLSYREQGSKVPFLQLVVGFFTQALAVFEGKLTVRH